MPNNIRNQSIFSSISSTQKRRQPIRAFDSKSSAWICHNSDVMHKFPSPTVPRNERQNATICFILPLICTQKTLIFGPLVRFFSVVVEPLWTTISPHYVCQQAQTQPTATAETTRLENFRKCVRTGDSRIGPIEAAAASHMCAWSYTFFLF